MKDKNLKNKSKKIEISREELEAKEIPLLFSVVNFSSNIPMSMYADTIGIKLPNHHTELLYIQK